eukprot:CAMPEP_0181115524 /NCGR_PEP_ID=MMETSP1071-20121207/21476_1 /TAXON_ID=35127 /ORGANISM="Thalassiosira sp., Strain NH16" /LENGTH=551 /DNA_ID=CAMNT_0023199733 /DNA_START=56 /DNA_END=1711 /DNA_ORIENTATION=+
MYSPYVSFVLGIMVVTGAARSIVAKLFFQLGFEHPLFLTLLYLAGQALSLIPYNIWRYSCGRSIDDDDDDDASLEKAEDDPQEEEARRRQSRGEARRVSRRSSTRFAESIFSLKGDPEAELFFEEDAIVGERRHSIKKNIAATTTKPGSIREVTEDGQQEPVKKSSIRFADESVDEEQQVEPIAAIEDGQDQPVKKSSIRFDESADKDQVEITAGQEPIKKSSIRFADESNDQEPTPGGNDSTKQSATSSTATTNSNRSKMSRSVSVHGLPTESRTAAFVNRIPWYVKPVVPAFFNLLNSAMRWASLIFVAASVAEMLISGMELVLSVVATRMIRGRNITWIRWVGVAIVTVGIILVGIFDSMFAAEEAADVEGEVEAEESSTSKQTIGIMLILGQSVMSVFQDLAEELFMQEADFPPALLVGMEGSIGLVMALILYFPIAPLLGYSHSDTGNDLNNAKIIGLSVGWTLLVTVTGIFNIAATGVTSSMTRNVWKNLRTCLVWIVGLIVFYASGDPDLGEPWVIPGSFYVLIGFSVMLGGVYVYYGKGAKAK